MSTKYFMFEYVLLYYPKYLNCNYNIATNVAYNWINTGLLNRWGNICIDLLLRKFSIKHKLQKIEIF